MTPPSATPRTDALHKQLVFASEDARTWIAGKDYCDMAEHARQLERELADRATPKPAQDEPVAWPSPDAEQSSGGWKISVPFLRKIQTAVDGEATLELIEEILLAAAPTSPGNASPAVPEVEGMERLVETCVEKALGKWRMGLGYDYEDVCAAGDEVYDQAAALIAAQAEELRVARRAAVHSNGLFQAEVGITRVMRERWTEACAAKEQAEAALKEAQHWRERHSKDAEERGAQSQANWERAQKAEAALRAAEREVADQRSYKDGAYLERNRLVALLAAVYPSGIKRTAIEGWSEDWHGCVYIDLPNGQASWHYHDSQAHLFAHIPPYKGEWDGHTTDEKYARIAELAAKSGDPEAGHGR